ncbi:MAG: hypothetical protein V1754_02060, partial [Pseudomonadota bacterium]
MKQKRFDEAQIALESILLDPQLEHLTDLIHFLRGEALSGKKAYLEAASAFTEAARSKESRWFDLAWEKKAQALQAANEYKLAQTT